MTVESDLMRGIPMQQASSCDNCGVENDHNDFLRYWRDWLCPDCYAEALEEDAEDE